VVASAAAPIREFLGCYAKEFDTTSPADLALALEETLATRDEARANTAAGRKSYRAPRWLDAALAVTSVYQRTTASRPK